jgi:nucleotide-binding universal stress UspA family protein
VAELAVLMDGAMAAEIDPQYDRDTLDALRKRLDGPDLKYPVETRLNRGFPQEEILQAAAEVEPTQIVMGTHGRTGLGRLLMGSVAESVIPKANCPVLVVKGPGKVSEPTAVRPTDKSYSLV